MSAEKLEVARAMYNSREHTTAKIAEVLGVSRATLYRHVVDERPGVTGRRELSDLALRSIRNAPRG